MAISSRRALISCRNISLLLRTSSHLSVCTNSAPLFRNAAVAASPPVSHVVPKSPAPINFLFESRRGFARGRKQWVEEEEEDDDDDDDDVDDEVEAKRVEIVNVGPTIMSATVSQMEAAMQALSHDLSKLRTGRASAGMLDHIIVETGGVKLPLSRMAVVSVLDPKTLSVTPYNPDALKELEKAIVSSPLSLNPKADGERLITAIPAMTKESMQAVCKVVAKSSEDVKQSIRRARQKALDSIKKALPKKDEKKKEKEKDKDKKKEKNKENAILGFSVDEARRLEREVDELTKKFIKSAEDMCKAKEKEITSS